MEVSKTEQIQVTVTFPLAESPFHGHYEGTATLGEVRAAAMQQFGAVEDPQYSYYLTHKGERLDDPVTLGSIAEHAHGLKFTLVKELIQG
jgi:hypothetical protein